ncbi:MAG: DUF3536 domain-containing protein [Spirochaetes bacterium]|nr:DUF3536 domain-containing protein [Spirochaetota bacterium]
MSRSVIIHGHFYQPPRENPWLSVITDQDVHPYHDWNERITAECYQPNASSRILDSIGRIVKVVNNYAHMSFNFGPTLLDYLADMDVPTARKIVHADRQSRERLGGHGNAIAQVYNHIILPLARYEDKTVQVRWGIRHFQRFFGRAPEGMWLSETAIDPETVDVLADCGIKYTILSPFQAARVIGEHGEKSVDGGTIDTSHPYILHGKRNRIAVFFYHAQLSQAIAFEHLLRDANAFGKRIRETFSDHMRLVNIATDGESYGHHEPFADMCLAKYLADIAPSDGLTVTNYGHFLAHHPATNTVVLHDGEGKRGTSWSCSHGVERWRSDCGCSTGAHPGWNQRWRTPLREAFDIVRDAVETAMTPLGHSAEELAALRDEYFSVLYDPDAVEKLHKRFAGTMPLTAFLKLMAAYRFSLFSYTSCGWFFADVSGIEPVQNMKYADIALELMRGVPTVPSNDIQERFRNKLAEAASNIAAHGTGQSCYEQWVLPDRYPPERMIYHFIACAYHHDFAPASMKNCMRFGYTFTVTKRTKKTITGTLTDPFTETFRFNADITEEKHDIIAYIALGDNGGKKRFSLADVVIDERIPLSRELLSHEISSVRTSVASAFAHARVILTESGKHGLPVPREFMHLFSAFFTLRMEALIHHNDGKFFVGKYQEIEELIALAQERHIPVSADIFGAMVEKSIRTKLESMLGTFSVETFNAVMTEMYLVDRIKLPIRRHALENIVYGIIEKYLLDRNFPLTEHASLIMLGQWFNFNMDEIGSSITAHDV